MLHLYCTYVHLGLSRELLLALVLTWVNLMAWNFVQALILGCIRVILIPQCLVSICKCLDVYTHMICQQLLKYILKYVYIYIFLVFIGRRLGSPINAWEAPVHTTHSPQHSTASSNSITATPTISPGVSTETQPVSTQQQQHQQQPPLSNSQPVAKVTKRFAATKRMSRPMSMANFFEHHNIETPPGQRRGEHVHEYIVIHIRALCFVCHISECRCT